MSHASHDYFDQNRVRSTMTQPLASFLSGSNGLETWPGQLWNFSNFECARENHCLSRTIWVVRPIQSVYLDQNGVRRHPNTVPGIFFSGLKGLETWSGQLRHFSNFECARGNHGLCWPVWVVQPIPSVYWDHKRARRHHNTTSVTCFQWFRRTQNSAWAYFEL